LQTKSEADQNEHRTIRVIVKRGTRRIDRSSLGAYVSNIEHDVHG
jgi:hypothetical protein